MLIEICIRVEGEESRCEDFSVKYTQLNKGVKFDILWETAVEYLELENYNERLLLEIYYKLKCDFKNNLKYEFSQCGYVL